MRDLGLYLFAVGIIILILYGLYRLIPFISNIDPIILISLSIIVIGLILIVISIMVEKGKEKEGISKEDLEP